MLNQSTVWVDQCTLLASNLATNAGGAIYASDSVVEVRGAQLADNSALYDGGGIAPPHAVRKRLPKVSKFPADRERERAWLEGPVDGCGGRTGDQRPKVGAAEGITGTRGVEHRGRVGGG